MRINQYLARATGLSRRAADAAVNEDRVKISGKLARSGDRVGGTDQITLDGKSVALPAGTTTIMLHKPVGYVCSRNGQGSRAIYELLPPGLHQLKPVGRLDKDSSGLLLLTNDGQLANRLTHPSFEKEKVYEVRLGAKLTPADEKAIQAGVKLRDGLSRLKLRPLDDNQILWEVRLHEGRNRQIRRTFWSLGYRVVGLHRRQFGQYELGNVGVGKFVTTD